MRLFRRKRVYVDDLPRTHDLRFFFVFVLIFVGVLGALYVVGYLATGDKLPRGTTVSGVDISGMRRDVAVTELQEELTPRLQRPIKATVLREEFRIDPQRAGLTFDIEATVDDALGGSKWDPRHMLKVLMGGSEVDPVIVLDETELKQATRAIDRRIRQPAQDSTVSFATGTPRARYGQPGRGLDQPGTGEALREALLAGSRSATLPVAELQPAVTPTEAADFVSGPGRGAVSGSLVLRVGGSGVTLQPAQFGPALRARTSKGSLRLDVDTDQLYDRTRTVLAALPTRPRNARVVIRDGRPVVQPSAPGVSVAREDWANALVRAASRSGDSRRAIVRVRPAEPAITTQGARRLGIRSRVSAYATPYPAAMAGDLRRASRQLNGRLMRQGGVLRFADSVRGGVSREAAALLAGTTYNAAFLAGAGELRASPNRVFFGRFPVGRDAQPDLSFVNDTRHGLLLRAYTTTARGAGTVHVEVWSTRSWQVTARTSRRTQIVQPGVERGQGPACRPRAGIPGFRVEVVRVVTRGGNVVKRDSRETRYIPLDAVVCAAQRPARGR